MTDMLVRLYDLPDYQHGSFDKSGIKIKKAIAPEKSVVTDFVRINFSTAWTDECEIAFSKTPTTCFIAYKSNEIIGFACYNVTAPNFFGPTGVLSEYQGLGIGKALLLESLYALKSEGYAYAIIGGVGPEEFYKKVVDATVIDHSDYGVYRDMVKG